mmetsp:Transcript_2923/g.10254  ORF Transcript_2923/g.10254 Transcript_2923/m.10254 type:complete len:245 (+) Transcript_2923:230-964(+)
METARLVFVPVAGVSAAHFVVLQPGNHDEGGDPGEKVSERHEEEPRVQVRERRSHVVARADHAAERVIHERALKQILYDGDDVENALRQSGGGFRFFKHVRGDFARSVALPDGEGNGHVFASGGVRFETLERALKVVHTRFIGIVVFVAKVAERDFVERRGERALGVGVDVRVPVDGVGFERRELAELFRFAHVLRDVVVEVIVFLIAQLIKANLGVLVAYILLVRIFTRVILEESVDADDTGH